MTVTNWTNVWLAAITLFALLQVVLFGLLLSVLARTSARLSATQDLIDRIVPPLAARATARLDEAESLIADLKQTDAMVRTALERAARIWSRTGDAVAQLWPVVGVARGLRALAATLGGSSRRRTHPRRSSQDAIDEARFAYESGHAGDVG